MNNLYSAFIVYFIVYRANQVDGDYWEAMTVKGQRREFGQNTRDTPLLFYDECHGIFNERQYSIDSIVSPSLSGALGPTQTTG